MAKPIGNDGKPSNLSVGVAGRADKPFFTLGEPLMLVISANEKQIECLSERLSSEFPRLDAPSRPVPVASGFNPWFEPISTGQASENPNHSLVEASDKTVYSDNQVAVPAMQPTDIERIAYELLGVIKNELCDENHQINQAANQKLIDAFKASSNPYALADTLTTLGREEHIQVGYDHGIYFYNYHSANGLDFPVRGILFEYNTQIPEGKPLGLGNDQIKQLADTVRDATTLDGDFTRLALAEIGMKPDIALLERVVSMTAMLAETGNPKQLVELLNRQISEDEHSVNRHGLNYINEVRIRVDYPRMPRAVSDRADSTAPRLQVMDPDNTFLSTIDLNK